MEQTCLTQSDIIIITLRSGHQVVVDIDDAWVCKRIWRVTNTGYAVAKVAGKNRTMHRLIMKADKGTIIDHANHNPLDNRKTNLRFCTQSANIANSRPKVSKSGYRGVVYRPERSLFQARLKVDGKYHYLSGYSTARAAAKAYNEIAKEWYGEFAVLNDV